MNFADTCVFAANGVQLKALEILPPPASVLASGVQSAVFKLKRISFGRFVERAEIGDAGVSRH